MSQNNSNYQRSETLTGVVERITFSAQDTGYTIARLQVVGEKELLTIVGNFANLQPGQTLKLYGYWKNHPKYGLQFSVLNYEETKPANITGIEKYLGSGLIKGVGPVTAKRIVKHFGLATLNIIEENSERLIEVEGIGKKRVTMIKRAWATQKVIKEVMIFLQGHGVSTTYAVKIYKQYGPQGISIVTDNPYQLADDIYGIGFLTADKIAVNVGISPWSKFRYRAGILYALAEAGDQGHCFLPFPELVEAARKILTNDQHQAETQAIEAVITQMQKEADLVLDHQDTSIPLCYKPAFYYSEEHLAKLLHQKISSPAPIPQQWLANWLNQFTAQHQIQLSPQQYQAVLMAGSNRVMILTGGPGCGKTFATRTIVALWQALGLKIALAAPTGRAAKRLAEMTGVEAKTIHRLLEFNRTTLEFNRNQDDPLPYQAICIDEASMLDLFLAYSLVKAIPPDCYLLLVGDVEQLPSVGPGNVLQDLIDCQQIPVVRLTQIFRQAAASGIIRSAHAINQGQYPPLEKISAQPQSDCLWHNGGTEPEHGLQLISELITDFLPHLGVDVQTDLQVLSPMTRGLVGTRNLNQVIQGIINPPQNGKVEWKRGGGILREGDRVIQQKNDYDKEVFNGDLGVIRRINTVEQEVLIEFDGRKIVYDYGDLNEISLAYAVTIHKSQGSEYPVVILPLYMQHYLMLSRNLFYTGLTRAKKLAIIIGQEKPISVAVKQVKDRLRYTKLKERLVSFVKQEKYSPFSSVNKIGQKVAENKANWDENIK